MGLFYNKIGEFPLMSLPQLGFDFDWWMEDPPSIEPVQRWISSWLWLEVDAQIFWGPCWLNPGRAVVFGR